MLRYLLMIWFATVLQSTSIFQCHGQSDLGRLIELLSVEKLGVVAEAKQLRVNSVGSRQMEPLFDYGYGLILMKFGQWQEAIDVLEPFVASRPQVYRVRLLVARCHLELSQYGPAVYQFEQLLQNLPSDPSVVEQLVRAAGTFTGYLRYARTTDVPDVIKHQLDELQQKLLPPMMEIPFQESLQSVEDRVIFLQGEIQKQSEKADREAELRITGNLQKAQELRNEADTIAGQLESTKEDSKQNLDQVRSDLQKMSTDVNQLLTQENLLRSQIQNMVIIQQSLVQMVEGRDNDGNVTRTTQIVDPVRYQFLSRNIANSNFQLQAMQIQARGMAVNYQQMLAQAKGIMDQKQYEELASKQEISELKSLAESKEKRAERDSQRKVKQSASIEKGFQLRIKNYSTYEPFDLRYYKTYLEDVSRPFLTKAP